MAGESQEPSKYGRRIEGEGMETHKYTSWLDMLVLYAAVAIVVGAVGWFLLG